MAKKTVSKKPSQKTALIVAHVTPELKAELEALGREEYLKLSPFVFKVLREYADKRRAS